MALINCPECNREISDKAKSCPNCGLPLKITPQSAPTTTPLATPLVVEPIKEIQDPTMKVCPSCKSHNVQSVKMMCLNGTSSGRSTGFGISSDLDIGIGSMNSASQTALAKQFSPGKSPAEVGGMVVGCSIVMLLSGKVLDNSFGHALFILGLFFIVIGISAIIVGCIPNKGREAKVKLYKKGWICHKCGNTWIPSEDNKESTAAGTMPHVNADNTIENLSERLSEQVTDKKNGKSLLSVIDHIRCNSKRTNIIYAIVLSCLIAIIGVNNCTHSMSDKELDAVVGHTPIEKYSYIINDSIKETPVGTFTVEFKSTKTSIDTNSKGDTYAYNLEEVIEINCKDMVYRSLGGNATAVFDKDLVAVSANNKPASQEWVNTTNSSDVSLVKVAKEVCNIAKVKYNIKEVTYSNFTTVFGKYTSARNQFGIYSIDKSDNYADFAFVAYNVFNHNDFDKMYNDSFKEKTPYESNDDYKARMIRSIDSFNNTVANYVDKNLKEKYITLKLKGNKNYTTQYDPDKKIVLFKLNGYVSSYHNFPDRLYLYGYPIVIRKAAEIVLVNKLADGIEMGNDTAIAYNILNNSGDLFITFKLVVRKVNATPDINISDISSNLSRPSLQAVKCVWIVNNKKLWSWEGEGE